MAFKVSSEVKTGILVVVAIALLVWGFHFLKGRNLFESRNLYYAVYERVDGLNESSPVFINGLKVGTVQEVYFHPNKTGQILVSFSIENNYPVPDSTVAELFSADLMGTKSIRLILGLSDKMHKIGDTLPSAIEADLKSQVSAQMLPIKMKAEELMSSIDSVMSVIQNIFNENTRENLSKTFASIKLTIQNLEHTSFALDTLMQHEKWVLARIFANIESITNNLKNNNEMLTRIITNFSAVSDSLAKSDIKSTVTNANLALTQANEIIAKINRGEGSLGMLLNNDSLYKNLESASRNLDLLVTDLRENPKRYVRFSLFDFGRTVVVDENGKKVKKSKDVSENTVIYKLQIRSAHKKIPSNSAEFKGLKNVDEDFSDGWYKYTVGGSEDLEEILKLQNLLSSKFPDAFVVAYSDGKRTALKVSGEM